jgi:hypothetical protein
MRRIGIIAALVMFSACQTSSQVVQAGKDTYMVSSHVAACVSCSASVQSLKTANEFCLKQGKYVSIRNSQSTTNAFGYEVGNELIFSCITEADPENIRPSLRNDIGVLTIENK